MKSVLLNNDGYTVDGQWRLVKIPTPTTAAEDDFKRMIAKSPAPELGEAVLSHYVNNDNGEVIPAEDFYDLPVSVWTPLFTAPPAPALPADWRSIVSEFICEAEQTYCPDSTCGYPDARCCRESMKRLVDEAKALLQSPAATDIDAAIDAAKGGVVKRG